MKRIVQRMGLATGGILFGLLLAEIVCRFCGMSPLDVPRERPMFWGYHPVYGWAHRPGQQGRFRMASFSTTVSINRRGLRDRDYAFEPSGRRILVLGDSLAWGFGVEQDETFTERLELMLPGTEVINAAVSGYSTDQELLWLERDGIRYRPDTVVVLVAGNDITMNTQGRVYYKYFKPYFTAEPDGGLKLNQVPVPRLSLGMTMLYQVRRCSALMHNMGHLLHRLRISFAHRRPGRGPVRQAAAPGGARHTEGTGKAPLTQDRPVAAAGSRPATSDVAPPHGPQELTVRLLDRMRTCCHGIGARLFVVTTRKFWEPEAGGYLDFLSRLKRDGFSVVDLEGCAGYREGPYTLQGDPHWNAAGHAFVAQCLSEHLAEN